MRGPSPVAASGGHSSSRRAGLSLARPLLLRSTGSRRAGSVIVAHGLSCSAACGIFPDQASSPCPLHWQADSQPLRHQGSPFSLILIMEIAGEQAFISLGSPVSLLSAHEDSLEVSSSSCSQCPCATLQFCVPERASPGAEKGDG